MLAFGHGTTSVIFLLIPILFGMKMAATYLSCSLNFVYLYLATETLWLLPRWICNNSVFERWICKTVVRDQRIQLCLADFHGKQVSCSLQTRKNNIEAVMWECFARILMLRLTDFCSCTALIFLATYPPHSQDRLESWHVVPHWPPPNKHRRLNSSDATSSENPPTYSSAGSSLSRHEDKI